MSFFKGNKIPSCSSCRYATEFIPYFTFPYSDPFCSKGNGRCEEDKLCGYYKLFGTYYCYECCYYRTIYYNNIERKEIVEYCDKKKCEIDGNNDACVYFKKNKEC